MVCIKFQIHRILKATWKQWKKPTSKKVLFRTNGLTFYHNSSIGSSFVLLKNKTPFWCSTCWGHAADKTSLRTIFYGVVILNSFMACFYYIFCKNFYKVCKELPTLLCRAMQLHPLCRFRILKRRLPPSERWQRWCRPERCVSNISCDLGSFYWRRHRLPERRCRCGIRVRDCRT